MPEGTYFIPFAKPGLIKEGMSNWEVEHHKARTLRAKKWIHACGRKNFGVSDISKYTYVCSLHFVQPIDESSDPIISTVQATTGRKRKAREQLMVEEGSGPGETDVNLEQSLELESLSVDKSTQTKDNSHLVNQLKIRYLDCQISLMKKLPGTEPHVF